MSQFLHILGRQPALGLAELESRCGAENVRELQPGFALVEDEDTALFPQLGGSVKVGKLLARLPTISWPKLIDHLSEYALGHVQSLSEGKIKLGLSVYGLGVRPAQINAAGLQLKKDLKHAGRSVRVVPNKEPALSSAQTLHNQLTGTLGIELMLVKNGPETLLAQVVHVQDIDSYTLRDRGRPQRDARVGMLPPKLAQIIINLAISENKIPTIVLDPFCGTGVVLQETLLIGLGAYGSDVSERMVSYSRDNINWLQEVTKTRYDCRLECADATTHVWHSPIDHVACETYLGEPLRTLPAPVVLSRIVQECDDLHRKFLKNIAGQLTSGTRLCLAVPAWRERTALRHLPVVDDLSDLGYNRVDFKHVRSDDLLYYREDQIVARELLVLIRK